MPRWSVTLSLVALLCASPARAGNQDIFGFGARGAGLGGASVAFARGWEAVYYNPAGILLGGERAFSVGLMAAVYDLSVDSPRPESVDGVADEDALSGLTVGIAVQLPLKGALARRIAIGLGLYIPTRELLAAEIPRPYTPQVSLVAGRARTVAIQAGIGVRIADWLMVGGGLRALAALQGRIDVGPNELGRLGSNVEDELVARYAGVVGLIAAPHPEWSLGLVWRSELDASFDLPITADFGDQLPLKVPRLDIAGVANFDPGQVALHVGWRPTPRLSVEAGVTWKDWSAFPLPIVNTTTAVPAQPPLDFEDTFVPRVGVEGTVPLATHWDLTMRGGYAFEPTPVPDQTGQHNFLDAHRHVASAGLGAAFTTAGGFRTAVDLYGQVHAFHARTYVKDAAPAGVATITDNAGWPWIGLSGAFYGFGAMVEIDL